MKPFIKNILLVTLLYLTTSCSKDFLNENIEQASIPVGVSNIYISPDWPGTSYVFGLPSVKEVDYEIVSKPSWLNISPVKGHLSDSVAIVQCSAVKDSAFDVAGIYVDFITISAGGKNYKIPVGYMNIGSPLVEVQSSLALSYSTSNNPYLTIKNTGPGILSWNISHMPDWLVLDTNRLEFEGVYMLPNTSYNIPLLYNVNKDSSGIVKGTMVLSTNDKKHPSDTINVTVNLGFPKLNTYTTSIDFSFMETSTILKFSNDGNRSLIWEFQDIPEWLTITPSNGICNSYSSAGNITFTCDREKMAPGQNSATVILKSNDRSRPSYSIMVKAYSATTSENVLPIAGYITDDAIFNKNTNILYFVTSEPDKLITYDVTSRTVLNEISLSRTPNCFTITEDWTKAAVGYDGFISVINLSSNTVTATYPVNYSVNDIAWGENDWFSYTQKGGDSPKLHWINTASGILYDDPEIYILDGNSIIKKVPDQPYLIATGNSTYPNGFIAYDIKTKSKKSYAHMNLYQFWFSENGEYIFAKDLNVYRTTSSTETTNGRYNIDINAIGKINTNNYRSLQNLYHSNNYLWVLLSTSYWPGDDDLFSIYQVKDNDYTLVKRYAYDSICKSDEQTPPFIVSARKIFANREGTELVVLCKGTQNNSWVMQFIPVE